MWTNEESERAIESSIPAECWTDYLEGCWQHWSGIKRNKLRSSLIVFDGLTDKDDFQGFRAVNEKDLRITTYPNGATFQLLWKMEISMEGLHPYKKLKDFEIFLCVCFSLSLQIPSNNKHKLRAQKV